MTFRSTAFWQGLLFAALLLLAPPALAQHHGDDHGDDYGDGHSASRFSDEPIPLIDAPERPRPLLELGPKFLGTGNISDGFRTPTGAVWTPAFMAFGSVRMGVNGVSREGGIPVGGVMNEQLGEVAGQFNLFGNLYLTQTERIVVGFRPLDEAGSFTSYTFYTDEELPEDFDEFNDELNFGVRTLFFEGDLAELFPKLDWDDSSPLDYYISVGRQPLSFQEGLLLNEDAIDMVGLTRANMKIANWVNTRAAGVFAWGDIDRPGGACGFANCGDQNALLFALFTETDTRKRTVELDVIYVLSDLPDEAEFTGGDGVYAGLSSTRRIGRFSNTFRVVGSMPVGDETNANRQGLLLLEQFGWTPHHTHDWAYVNVFGGVGEFRSATRAPTGGAALGGTAGLLFTPAGLGRYAAPLGSSPDGSVGASFGYQKFFGHFRRKQLTVEVGGRYGYMDEIDGRPLFAQDAAGAALRYAFAVGRRGVVTLDGFGSFDFTDTDNSQTNFGARVEVAVNL